MKKISVTQSSAFIVFFVCLPLLVGLACSTPAATPNAQATVQAAVAATNAVPNAQATVDAAVAATAGAQAGLQATIDASVQATAGAMPTPTPSAEYVTMTEEELAALIDQAVAEAVAATSTASASTSQATADGAVTQSEVQEVQVTVTASEEAIALAEEVLSAYYDLYGELATETLALLNEIEADLELMAASMAELSDALVEISNTLAAGLELATETITQLQATAQTASARLAETQAKAQALSANAKTQRDNRASAALAMKPDEIPQNREEALGAAFDYIDTIKEALSNGKLSMDELTNIARKGANAAAGLQNFGGDKLSGLASRFSGSGSLTHQLALGQVPQARAGLSGLERSMGDRPANLPRPGGGNRPRRP